MADPAIASRDAERYRTLLEINNALVSNLTRDGLFHAIAQSLRRALPFERTAIFLHDPGTGTLKLFILESSLPSAYFTVGFEMALDSHVGVVFRTQTPLVRRDLTVERRYPAEEMAFGDGVRAYVIVPLVIGGASIGALAVASIRSNQYAETDVPFLQEVAAQVALAVANMTAYEQIAALKARLERENVYLQEEIRGEHNFVEMVGNSPPLSAVLRRVEQVALTTSTVLISGETGTGKELVARAIHSRSARRDLALVKVNCAAISVGLVESELFGHVKGAFTGAIERRIGRFELADKGTIFLDEVGELPLDTQVKLLRVLQEQEFEPVGSSRTVKVDVRVIAATNRDLERAVQDGRFRADLYYRLNVVPVRLPSLRERPGDIPMLAMFFLAQVAQRYGKRIDGVAPEAMERLVAYAWPGNIRELQNVIERGVVLCQGPALELDEDLLPIAAAPAGPVPRTHAIGDAAQAAATPLALPTLGEVERAHVLAVLQHVDWLIEGPRGAAKILGLHPNTLRSRIQKLGIKRPRHDMS